MAGRIHKMIPGIVSQNPDNKIHWANIGPTWVLSAPDGPYVGPMNLVTREGIGKTYLYQTTAKHNEEQTVGMRTGDIP